MNRKSGFTIVELLVVIVVIGVLAAITIVSYSGIAKQAIVASIKSDLTNSARLLKVFNTDNGYYPEQVSTTCTTDTATTKCLKLSSDNQLDDQPGNPAYTRPTLQSFILRIKNGNNIWVVTDNSAPGEVAPLTSIANITGTVRYGEVLSAGVLSPSGATATYKWQISTSSNGTYSDIPGATSITYSPTANDVGKYLKVVATGTLSYFNSVSSSAVGPIAGIPLISMLPPSGTAEVGQTLTAGALNPSGATVSYQWQYVSGYDESSGESIYSLIPGATSASYTPTTEYGNQQIRLLATGTGGYSGTLEAYLQITPVRWVAGRNGTVLQGKYVYYTNLWGQWKTTSTSCASPQCTSGSLVTSNTVDFTQYPARNVCKNEGGYLPNQSQLNELWAGRSYYNLPNDTGNIYWSSQEYSATNASLFNPLTQSYSVSGLTKTYGGHARCIKD